MQEFGEVSLEIFEDRVKISSEAVEIEVKIVIHEDDPLRFTLDFYLTEELEKMKEELKKL